MMGKANGSWPWQAEASASPARTCKHSVPHPARRTGSSVGFVSSWLAPLSGRSSVEAVPVTPARLQDTSKYLQDRLQEASTGSRRFQSLRSAPIRATWHGLTLVASRSNAPTKGRIDVELGRAGVVHLYTGRRLRRGRCGLQGGPPGRDPPRPHDRPHVARYRPLVARHRSAATLGACPSHGNVAPCGGGCLHLQYRGWSHRGARGAASTPTIAGTRAHRASSPHAPPASTGSAFHFPARAPSSRTLSRLSPHHLCRDAPVERGLCPFGAVVLAGSPGTISNPPSGECRATAAQRSVQV